MKLTHVDAPTRGVAETAAFYRDTLGFAQAWNDGAESWPSVTGDYGGLTTIVTLPTGARITS